MLNDYNFGNFVCELREEKGLTQAELAQQLGVSPAAVSKWENGSSKPRVEVLFQLAQLLGVHSEELLAGHRLEAQLSPDAIARINERFEYLQRVDNYSSVGVKFRRAFAFLVDWNLIGFVVLFLLAVLFPVISNQVFVVLLLILLFPAGVMLRDLIFGTRSLGKRIFGLVVLDKKTGDIAKPGQRVVRCLFSILTYVEAIIIFVSGRSIGDRVADTVVVPKKAVIRASEDSMSGSSVQAYVDKSPKPWTVKRILIVIGIVFVCVLLIFGIISEVVRSSLSAVKDTEQYRIAYAYLVGSQSYEALGVSEQSIRLSSYSMRSGKQDGVSYATTRFIFDVGSATFCVICHMEDDVWTVCSDCTDFE